MFARNKRLFNGGVAIRNERGAGGRPTNRPFFIVVVVTQAEADFRFGLSPEGTQKRSGGRLLAEAEEGGRRGRNKNFCAPRAF